MTMSLKLKTILMLRPFKTSPHMSNSDCRNSNSACKSVFFLVMVLVKARFLDSKVTVTDSKSKTVLFTTRFQRSYDENFGSQGAIAAEK
jgi:hypothetical protein